MMENFPRPSPGASCGSPFSDVTSGSPGFSDVFEPVSPAYNLDTLKADFGAVTQMGGSASLAADIAAEDTAPEDDQAALEDYRFYQTLPVGSVGATDVHVSYLLTKLRTGRISLPTKNSSARPNSSTPYSDFAKSKKPGKEGAIKRPLNNFMCFSKIERGQLMTGQPELHNARISEHLGNVWKQSPKELKDLYREMAEFLKELHKQEHPEYKYRPRKRKAAAAGSASGGGVPGVAAAAASPDLAVSSDGSKPKRVRKPAAKPRSRSRKNTSSGQAHVVPTTSNLADIPPTPDSSNEQLYADVLTTTTTYVLDGHHKVVDLKPSISDLQRFSAGVSPSLNVLQRRLLADVIPSPKEFQQRPSADVIPSPNELQQHMYADVVPVHFLNDLQQQRLAADVNPSLDELQSLVSGDVNPSLDDSHQRPSAGLQPMLGELFSMEDIDGSSPLFVDQPEQSEADLASAGNLADRPSAEARIDEELVAREETQNNGMDDLLALPSLDALSDLNFSCDEFGFELGSENLVEGPQVHDALEYSGGLPNLIENGLLL
ncbi:hypothetical protein ACOMHN_052470 [Nucella lapillus]